MLGCLPDPCPACGATETVPLYWKPQDGELAQPGRQPPGRVGYQIVGCTTCGLGRLDPIPSPGALARLYTADYFAPYAGQISDPLTRPIRPARDTSRLEAVRAAGLRRYEQVHVARLAMWYATPPSGSPRLRGAGREGLGERSTLRFLDVGCGIGGVLEAAEARGWTAVGVEPSTVAARLAAQAGRTVVRATLDEAGFPDAAFDLVHLREVLEHVADPLALVREARRVLKPGGMLYLQVPNDLLGYRRWWFRRVWWLIPPFHLWYFTFVSLERLLARIGMVSRVRGTLGFGMGYDTYRYLGARLGLLPWLDRNEATRFALVPRLTRAAFKTAFTPADWMINHTRQHSSLWLCAF